jgi:hypothetical protein
VARTDARETADAGRVLSVSLPLSVSSPSSSFSLVRFIDPGRGATIGTEGPAVKEGPWGGISDLMEREEAV